MCLINFTLLGFQNCVLSPKKIYPGTISGWLSGCERLEQN